MAGESLISGRKSIETVQAYLLLSLYPAPREIWADDRGWMFLGCAIRMATDLNLQHPPVLKDGNTATTMESIEGDEGQAREVLNRTRAWLVSCYSRSQMLWMFKNSGPFSAASISIKLLRRNSERRLRCAMVCYPPFFEDQCSSLHGL